MLEQQQLHVYEGDSHHKGLGLLQCDLIVCRNHCIEAFAMIIVNKSEGKPSVFHVRTIHDTNSGPANSVALTQRPQRSSSERPGKTLLHVPEHLGIGEKTKKEEGDTAQCLDLSDSPIYIFLSRFSSKLMEIVGKLIERRGSTHHCTL